MIAVIHCSENQDQLSDCSPVDIVWPQRSAVGTENIMIYREGKGRGKCDRICSSNTAESSRMVDVSCLDVSADINPFQTKVGPASHIGNIKLSGSSWLVGGLLGLCREVTSHHGLLGRRYNHGLVVWNFCQMAPVSLKSSGCGISSTFSHFSAIPLSATSECWMPWHKELVRWPPLPPLLTSVRELFPVAVLWEIIQHLYFN